MSNFFICMKTIDELKNALKAYNQSETYQIKKNPDLYFNRGNVLSYLEDYAKACENYDNADKLDKQLGC